MERRLLYALLLLFLSPFALLVDVTTVSAQPTVELAYDDGTASGSTSVYAGEFMTVRFSLPSGWSEGRLLTARIAVLAGAGKSFKVHILDSDGVTPPATGWLDVDLSAFNLVVTGDFYIAVEFETNKNPWIGYDKTPPIDGRSYYGQPSSWASYGDRDLMIRAVIQKPTLVGGIISPVYELYLQVFCTVALVIVASLIIVVKKRIS